MTKRLGPQGEYVDDPHKCGQIADDLNEGDRSVPRQVDAFKINRKSGNRLGGYIVEAKIEELDSVH